MSPRWCSVVCWALLSLLSDTVLLPKNNLAGQVIEFCWFYLSLDLLVLFKYKAQITGSVAFTELPGCLSDGLASLVGGFSWNAARLTRP